MKAELASEKESSRILVLGATGMLGHKVVQRLRRDCAVVATTREAPSDAVREILSGAELVSGVDVTTPGQLEALIADVRPTAVINCVGVIKQLAEAKDPIAAIGINALLPHRIHRACLPLGARLIHFSTDCVFSGRKGRYTEDDEPDATDLYGRSKLLGEVSGEGALTLRTSIIGRELRAGHGLLEWFISSRGRTVRGFRRAIYSGLTTLVAADLVASLLRDHRDLTGVWHVSSDPIDKLSLLRLVNEELSLGVEIEPFDDFACDRSMLSDRFRSKTGFDPPSWPEMIRALAHDPTPYPTLSSVQR